MKLFLTLLITMNALSLWGYETTPITAKPYTATLISSTIDDSKKAIFYIHGFNDYLFNEEMMDHFNKKGYQFFGIDLHHYGRNLYEDNTTPYYFSSVEEFFPEIKAAIEEVKIQYDIEDITLIAHSQGGLIASLFVDTYPNIVHRLILNSPFLDFYAGGFLERIAIPTVAFIGRFLPMSKLPDEGSNLYGKSIHKDYFGEWTFDRRIKRINNPSAPIYFGWLNAARQAQKRLQKGLNIPIPVLVMHSDKSMLPTDIDTDTKAGIRSLHTHDIVLDVEDIKRYGKTLGNDVKLMEIKDGIHDLLLSEKMVREIAYQEIFEFIQTH